MAAGPATYAAHIVGGLVRQLWPDDALIAEIIAEDPVLGMSEKQTDWGYSIVHFPLGYGANQGIGRVFADAKRLKTQAKQQEFQVVTREMFSALSLEGKLLRSFEYTKKKALLVEPVQREGEATIDRMRRRFSKAIHGNGVGVLGKIAAGSNLATDTITLTDFNDLKNFEEDTPIIVEQTGITGGTPLPGEARVTAFGIEDNPTVQIAGGLAWNVVFPGITAGASLYYPGTYDNDFIQGFDAYLPFHTGATGTNPISAFLTCTRAKNPNWLGGRCMDGTKLSVYQRIKRAARICFDGGNKPDTYLLSTRNFERLEFEFDNKLMLQKFPAADVGGYKMGVSYTGVVVQGPRGPIKVLPSVWMPDSVERCGEMEQVVIGSIGPLVHWDLGNGMGSMKELRTEDQTDNRELRAVSDPAFVVKKPGAWVRVAC